MGHTNSTTNYSLPQFITTDKPAWLTDINGAFSSIDTAIHNAQTDATTAGSDASQALLDASSAASAASTADSKASGALASIEATFDPTTVYPVGAKVIYNSLLYRCTVAVTTPGPWTGVTNWERITVDSTIPVTSNDLPVGVAPYTVGSVAEALNGKLDVSTWSAQGTAVVNPAVGTGSVYYHRIGSLIILYGNITTSGGVAVNNTIFSNIPTNTNTGYNNVIKLIDNDGVSADWVLYQRPTETYMLNAAPMTGGHTFTISACYYSA